MEHSIATLTPARVAKVDRKEMEELIVTRPAIMRAFLWTLLVDEDTLRAWIVSMGRRDSVQRVAHLMCELYVRALNIGLTVGDRFEMPLTQIVLGDALGLTPVHVNRVLRKLKVSGVMSLSRGSLVIADIANSRSSQALMTTTFIGACADHRRTENNEEDPTSTLTAPQMHATTWVRLKAAPTKAVSHGRS
jgi:hypothetical protein